MLCEANKIHGFVIDVLILVLMEYALREPKKIARLTASQVLILVLMEYALRDGTTSSGHHIILVLILVLMEYALREHIQNKKKENEQSLNPCFNGICSASMYWSHNL